MTMPGQGGSATGISEGQESGRNTEVPRREPVENVEETPLTEKQTEGVIPPQQKKTVQKWNGKAKKNTRKRGFLSESSSEDEDENEVVEQEQDREKVLVERRENEVVEQQQKGEHSGTGIVPSSETPPVSDGFRVAVLTLSPSRTMQSGILGMLRSLEDRIQLKNPNPPKKTFENKWSDLNSKTPFNEKKIEGKIDPHKRPTSKNKVEGKSDCMGGCSMEIHNSKKGTNKTISSWHLRGTPQKQSGEIQTISHPC